MSNQAEQQQSTQQNVDAAEIDKFSQLAHQWWDKEGEFKPLHDINPLRLNFITQITPLLDKNILDVGCGGGILTEAMAQSGAKSVLGVDLAEKSIKMAGLHAMASAIDNVKYQTISIEELAQEKPASFDVVTCMEMLEHVPNPSSVVHACADLVKPGGYVFFSTINRNVKAYFQAILAAEKVLKLMPPGTHEYKKFITPSELARMCRYARLEWVDSSGLTYNPLNKIYRLTPSLDVNYMIATKKPG